MLTEQHSKLVDFIWEIAERLRGPYRPPQYRRIMLPLIVLRRLDQILEDGKEAVLKEYKKLKAQGFSKETIHKTLGKKSGGKSRRQPLYNISPYTFTKLLGDPDGLASNLTLYIKGFPPTVHEIFDKFKFEAEIEVLENKNRLFTIIREFANPKIDLHPDRIMGDDTFQKIVAEHLVREVYERLRGTVYSSGTTEEHIEPQ